MRLASSVAARCGSPMCLQMACGWLLGSLRVPARSRRCLAAEGAGPSPPSRLLAAPGCISWPLWPHEWPLSSAVQQQLAACARGAREMHADKPDSIRYMSPPWLCCCLLQASCHDWHPRALDTCDLLNAGWQGELAGRPAGGVGALLACLRSVKLQQKQHGANELLLTVLLCYLNWHPQLSSHSCHKLQCSSSSGSVMRASPACCSSGCRVPCRTGAGG